MRTKVILVGAFHEIIELCEITGYEIVGIFDNKLTTNYLGYKILGTDDSAKEQFKKLKRIPIIVSPDLPAIRKKIVDYYKTLGFNFINLISPMSTISKSAQIGNGVIIQNGVNISSNAIIGDFVKINSLANIMHDSHIGEFSTIAPNAVILGRVIVNKFCYIGANATILPEIEILANVTVGAGAVVTKNIDKNIIVVGNPATKLKRSV
jgi:UDP-N-acetylbacillosamine N-acetyltransferase